jgi:uncharacterized protein YbaP (TraB family)
VAGRHNTLYLMGSVHVLHADDSALPAVANAAYTAAERIVEELDLFSATAELFSPEAMALQILPEGSTLQQVLGAELHGRLVTAVQPLGIDADFLARMQPWYIATMIAQVRAARAGYTAETGVDYQIAMRARRDGKPLTGLETALDQLAVLASMSLEDQSRFLEATIEETGTVEELQRITQAWRNGDLALLEDLLRQGAEEAPEFFKRLVADRNRTWMPQIEQMLEHPTDDYLVVTGAAHMVGEEGLVALLRSKGFVVTRK